MRWRRSTEALSLLLASVVAASGQPARDTTLFTIPLVKGNPAAVRSCDRSGNPADVLSGPVVMAGNSLLLFSSRGYLLYDSAGSLLDSHCVTSDANLRLAFPFDSVSLLYYRPATQPNRAVDVFRKRLLDPMLGEVSAEEYRWLGAVHVGVFVNIACNAYADSRLLKLNLAPQLVGYTALAGGSRWWALDRNADLSSPLLRLGADGRGSLFAGLFATEGAAVPREQSVELRATFLVEGRRWYMGVWAQSDLEQPRCDQQVLLCDEAGNLLYKGRLLKQENMDVLLGLSSADGENTMSFVRGASRLAFPPVADGDGRVYYGVLDHERCSFSVQRIDILRYLPMAAGAAAPQLFAAERDVAFEPIDINVVPGSRTGAEIPRVSFTAADGSRRIATVTDLGRGGWLARMGRQQWRDLEAKLSRGVPGLPTVANRLRDSLASLPTAGCPYYVSLSGPAGYTRSFAYGVGEVVLCARILGVLPDSSAVVRVDLPQYAEALLFRPDGAFVNRFTFTRQPWKTRRDLLVVKPDGVILEMDYEQAGGGDGVFVRWEAALP